MEDGGSGDVVWERSAAAAAAADRFASEDCFWMKAIAAAEAAEAGTALFWEALRCLMSQMDMWHRSEYRDDPTGAEAARLRLPNMMN